MKKCPVCSETGFDDIQDVREHRRNAHSERVVTCSCGRTFLEQRYMEQHLRDLGPRHGQQKTRRVRSKRSKRNESLPHPCGICDRSFAKASSLQSHKKAKHPASAIGMVGFDTLTTRLSAINIYSSASSSSVTGRSPGFNMFASTPLPSDLYRVDSSDLERFIAEKIQADDVFLSSCGSVINRLAENLKGSSSPFRPRRIIKSGSLGKGTSVKGKSDVDLILMLNDYDNVTTLMTHMPIVLKRLHTFLGSTIASPKKPTRFSVPASMACGDHVHDVDILPGVDLIDMGKSPREIYRLMEHASQDLIHEYSVTLSPLQLDIIKNLPTKVKNLIRLVKYWKNEKLKGSSVPEMPSFADKKPGEPAWPSSYALELVVMNSWIQAGKPESFDMTRAIHSILTSLVNHTQLTVLLRDYMLYDDGMVRHGSGPYIMDPTNPYNDMYHGLVNGRAFDWDKAAMKAREWLGKELFSGVHGTKNMW